MSVFHSNSRTTSDCPALLIELMRTSWRTMPSSCSRGRDTSDSTSSGAVPGNSVRTVIAG